MLKGVARGFAQIERAECGPIGRRAVLRGDAGITLASMLPDSGLAATAKIAIVSAGLAGLTAARELRKAGHAADVFEGSILLRSFKFILAPSLRPSKRLRTPALLLSMVCFAGHGSPARADECGGSFWLLGSYAMQAAIASAPGFSVDMTYYSSGASFKRWDSTPDGRIEQSNFISANYLMLTPSYAFENRVLGAQLEVGLTVLAGSYASTMSTFLFSACGPPDFDTATDAMTAFGDLFHKSRGSGTRTFTTT